MEEVGEPKFIYGDYRFNYGSGNTPSGFALFKVSMGETNNMGADELFKHVTGRMSNENLGIFSYPKDGLYEINPNATKAFYVFYESDEEFKTRQKSNAKLEITIIPREEQVEEQGAIHYTIHYIRQIEGENVTLEDFKKIMQVGQSSAASLESPLIPWQGPLILRSQHLEAQRTGIANLVKKHIPWLGVNGVLFVAGIVILATLASLPIGGLPILAGLSVLAVAGLAVGAAFLFWNLGYWAVNLIRKDGGGAPSPTEELLQIQEDKLSLTDQPPLPPQKKSVDSLLQPPPIPASRSGVFHEKPPPESDRVKLNEQIRDEFVAELARINKEDNEGVARSLPIFLDSLKNAKVCEEGIYIPKDQYFIDEEATRTQLIAKEVYIQRPLAIHIIIGKLTGGVFPINKQERNVTHEGVTCIFFSNDRLNAMYADYNHKKNQPTL